METVAETVSRWRAEGIPCALARVVATGGSAPLASGTAMAVSATGEVIGGVSGGCVDGAVYTLCREVTADGRPTTAVFGPDGDELLAVGPTCGGSLEVLVEYVPPHGGHPVDRVTAALREGRPVVVATALDGPRAGEWAVLVGTALVGNDDDDEDSPHPGEPLGDHPGEPLGDHPGEPLGELLCARATDTLGRPGTAVLDSPAGRVFVQSLAPPRLLVFGATAFAEALVRIGALLGYWVTVCDARPVFVAPERFPAAAEVVRCWPHEFLRRTRVGPSTAICVLTHDPRFDIPLLTEALRTDAGYIGAMGSRRTHTERLTSLREAGVGESELRRLRSPIGLDLGARTAAETAVSIAAELVAHHRGGTGAPLTGLEMAIHR
ncbi:XdhC family protein [Dietzia cercidiphylli]|uniref:XdhC family protein n=2 Tax=Dietzia cercidiphylli TaxID=498199 RepID=A0ABN2I6N1_9ACTN